MRLDHSIYITLDRLDFELSFHWDYLEYPQVGDSISIVGLCSDEQKREFEQMSLPPYANTEDDDFLNVLEYLTYYVWVVTQRSWGYSDNIEITCSPRDPFIK